MQKINITKEEFLHILKKIRKQKAKTEAFNKALDSMCDGYIVFDTNNEYLDALLFVLSKMFFQVPNSEFNTIEWYLFESAGKDNEHTMYYAGHEININTDELLYELLCAEFEQRANNNDEPIVNLFKTKGSPISQEDYFKKYNISSVHYSKNISADEIIEKAKERYIENLKEGNINDR